jgi:hypothetical protein
MMMIKKYIVFILAVFVQLSAGAQVRGLYNGNLNQNSNRLQGKLMGEIYYLNPVSNANYFLQPDWKDGVITLKDGDVFDSIRMRYMAFGDELVAYNNNIHSLFIVDKNTVKQFTFREHIKGEVFAERKFVNLDFLGLPLNRIYFEELYSGTAKLFSFHHIEEEKVSPYIDLNGKMYDVEFRLKTTYYILSDSIGFTRIQLKKRSFYSLFPENRKEIKKILRKNRINITNQVSAIEALKILDEAGYFK